MQTQQCQTGMCPSAGHRQKQERGLGRDTVQRRPFLLNVDSHSAKRWWHVQFPSPLTKASSRLSLSAARAQRLWSYRGLFMRTCATCPAAFIARPECYSLATPWLYSIESREVSQACEAAILKWISQLQTRRGCNLSSPFLPSITMEICIRGSVMGCIKYATGLSAQIWELQNWRTAAPAIMGSRWRGWCVS